MTFELLPRFIPGAETAFLTPVEG